MRQREPKVLSDVVPGLVRDLGLTAGNFAVLALVESSVRTISPTAEIVAFKDGRVTVEAESPVHLYELTARKREILRQVLPLCPGKAQPLEVQFRLKGTARPGAQERVWGPKRAVTPS